MIFSGIFLCLVLMMFIPVTAKYLVAIGIPMTFKHSSFHDIENSPLYTVALPSIARTTLSDADNFKVGMIYLIINK